MGFFLFVISLLFIAEGVWLILRPRAVVRFANELLKNKNLKTSGIVPLVVGILLLLAAHHTILGWLIVLLGLASIGKAVYVFLVPAERIRKHWWFTLSDNGYRGLGILILILGVIVFISRI